MRYRDLFALPSGGALENLHPREPEATMPYLV